MENKSNNNIESNIKLESKDNALSDPDIESLNLDIININLDNNIDLKKKTKIERPIFRNSNNINNKISAAGILFWRFVSGGNIEFLMSFEEYYNKWSDIGGKTEIGDPNYMYTAARECSEETNDSMISGIYKKDFVDDLDRHNKCIDYVIEKIKKNTLRKFYIKDSKYYLYLVRLRGLDCKYIDKKRIGKKEKLTKNNRIIQWLTHKEILNNYKNNNIHIRINNKYILEYIKNKENFKK